MPVFKIFQPRFVMGSYVQEILSEIKLRKPTLIEVSPKFVLECYGAPPDAEDVLETAVKYLKDQMRFISPETDVLLIEKKKCQGLCQIGMCDNHKTDIIYSDERFIVEGPDYIFFDE